MADKQKETLKVKEPRPRNSHADLSLPLSLVMLRMKLNAVAHAVKCQSSRCQHQSCDVVKCQSSRCQHQSCDVAKKLFRHVVVCRRGPGGGCRAFNRTWRLIRVHIKSCKESNCNCRKLPECLTKLRQKYDTRRMLHEQEERLGRLQLQQPDSPKRGAGAEDADTSLVKKASIF